MARWPSSTTGNWAGRGSGCKAAWSWWVIYSIRPSKRRSVGCVQNSPLSSWLPTSCSLQEVGSHEERGEFCTQPTDRRFEGLIEYITHHDHAALHPLPLPAQFPVVELGHRAIAVHQGVEQGHHRIRTDTIALGELCDFLLSFRSKLSHTGDPLHSESIA